MLAAGAAFELFLMRAASEVPEPLIMQLVPSMSKKQYHLVSPDFL